MSPARSPHEPRSEAEVVRLIREHPLAWIVTTASSQWRATPLPLRAECIDAQGGIETLLGHFARSNPHAALIGEEPRSLVLFMGVNGYISPSWMQDRTQAPTWNYASVQYLCELEVLEDEAARDALLADLVSAMEAGRSGAWTAAEMGARYQTLARRILPFRARILERRAKFKLGQDERDSTYADIAAALGDDTGAGLREWMDRANPSRPRR